MPRRMLAVGAEINAHLIVSQPDAHDDERLLLGEIGFPTQSSAAFVRSAPAAPDHGDFSLIFHTATSASSHVWAHHHSTSSGRILPSSMAAQRM